MIGKETLDRQLYLRLLAAPVALGVASLLIHPFGDVRSRHSVSPLLAGTEIDPATVRIIERSCRNCHSEQTAWPWYSYFAPLSWLMEKDVRDARGRMNLSRWSENSPERKHELLTEIAAAIRSHQ